MQAISASLSQLRLIIFLFKTPTLRFVPYQVTSKEISDSLSFFFQKYFSILDSRCLTSTQIDLQLYNDAHPMSVQQYIQGSEFEEEGFPCILGNSCSCFQSCVELEIPNSVCLDRFSIVYYQTCLLLESAPFRRLFQGVAQQNAILKNNILSTFIIIPKIPCLALMVGSENKLVMMGTKFGRDTC